MSNREIQQLKREMADLKSWLQDKVFAQTEQNGTLNVKLETMKLRMEKLGGLNRKLNFLIDKYKEQRGQVNLLVQLLRGRWEKGVCECGRQVTTLVEERRSPSPPDVVSPSGGIFQTDVKRSESQKVSSTTVKDDNIDQKRRQGSLPFFKRKLKRDEPQHQNKESIRTPPIITKRDKSVFTYSDESQQMIGKSLSPFEKDGPSLSLSSNDGSCKFFLSEDPLNGKSYADVMSGVEFASFRSKFIVLPDQFESLIVRVMIISLNKHKCELRLIAESELNQNRNVSLPIKLKLQIEMNQQKSSSETSSWSFNIDQLSTWIRPQNGELLIPLANIKEDTFNGGMKMIFSLQ